MIAKITKKRVHHIGEIKKIKILIRIIQRMVVMNLKKMMHLEIKMSCLNKIKNLMK